MNIDFQNKEVEMPCGEVEGEEVHRSSVKVNHGVQSGVILSLDTAPTI